MARHQSPYELQRNEVLVRAAQLSSQFGVDMALLMNDGAGNIKYCSSGSVEGVMRRLQEMPTAEALTKDQVLRHHESGSMPLPNHQGGGQWSVLGRQGAWLQLIAPSGQTVQLPALRPPGFLDRSHCPVSPRSEAAYASLTQELDRLCDLATAAKRRKLTDAACGVNGNGLHPHHHLQHAGGSGSQAGSLQAGGGTGSDGAVGGRGGGGEGGSAKSSRFKALSVEVPHQQVVGARPAGGQGAGGPQTLEMMGPESMVLPSPSGFLTSGPQSLGGMQFTMDMLISARGPGPSPRNDMLVAGQLGRLGDGGGSGAAGPRGLSDSGAGLLGELASDLGTPNSSMQLNGYMWSPHSSNATGGKNPGGFTEDTEGEEGGGQEVEGAADLVVLGRSLSKATLQALDSKASAGAEGAASGVQQQQQQQQQDAGAAGGEGEGASGEGSRAAVGTGAPASAIDIPIDLV